MKPGAWKICPFPEEPWERWQQIKRVPGSFEYWAERHQSADVNNQQWEVWDLANGAHLISKRCCQRSVQMNRRMRGKTGRKGKNFNKGSGNRLVNGLNSAVLPNTQHLIDWCTRQVAVRTDEVTTLENLSAWLVAGGGGWRTCCWRPGNSVDLGRGIKNSSSLPDYLKRQGLSLPF